MNRWSRCWVVCLAVAVPALGAENYDGTYTGKRVLTKGAQDQTCPAEDDVSVTIHGAKVESTTGLVHRYVLGFEPHPDGSFSMISTDAGSATVLIAGRVVGDVIDADVTTPSCQFHWHLKRG